MGNEACTATDANASQIIKNKCLAVVLNNTAATCTSAGACTHTPAHAHCIKSVDPLQCASETSSPLHPDRRCDSYRSGTCHKQLVVKDDFNTTKASRFIRIDPGKKSKCSGRSYTTCLNADKIVKAARPAGKTKTIGPLAKPCKLVNGQCKEDTINVVRPQICTVPHAGYYLKEEDDWEKKQKIDECYFIPSQTQPFHNKIIAAINKTPNKTTSSSGWTCYNKYMKEIIQATPTDSSALGTVTVLGR